MEVEGEAHLAELPEQLNEAAFAKGVGEAGVEGQGGVNGRENGHPAFL